MRGPLYVLAVLVVPGCDPECAAARDQFEAEWAALHYNGWLEHSSPVNAKFLRMLVSADPGLASARDDFGFLVGDYIRLDEQLDHLRWRRLASDDHASSHVQFEAAMRAFLAAAGDRLQLDTDAARAAFDQAVAVCAVDRSQEESGRVGMRQPSAAASNE